MGFPQKNAPAQTAEKAKDYKKIASIWNSTKFQGCYASADDYFGDLIFHNKATGVFYKVKNISLFEPKPGAPANLVYNMVINLENQYDVAVMGNEEDAQATGG